jgi:hypothetical protein
MSKRNSNQYPGTCRDCRCNVPAAQGYTWIYSGANLAKIGERNKPGKRVFVVRCAECAKNYK